jgi:hypothetical protein
MLHLVAAIAIALASLIPSAVTAGDFRASIAAAQIVLLSLAIALIIQADSPARPDGHWLTRPIGRLKMVVSKFLFVIMVVGVPAVGCWLIALVPMNSGRNVAILMAGEYGLYFLGNCVVVMVFSAVTPRLRHFCFVFIALYLFAAILPYASVFRPSDFQLAPEASISIRATTLLVVSILGLTSAFVLILQYLGKLPGYVLVLAVLIAGGMPLYLPRSTTQPLPKTSSSLKIGPSPSVHSEESAGPGDQILWHNFLVSGLEDDEFVLATQFSGIFRTAGGDGFSVGLPHTRDYAREVNCFLGMEFIRNHLPEDANLIVNPRAPNISHFMTIKEFGNPDRSEPVCGPGRIQASIDLVTMQPEVLGDLPLKKGAELSHKGYAFRVDRVIDNSGPTLQVHMTEWVPDLLFSNDLGWRKERRGRGFGSTAFVLHRPDTLEYHVDLGHVNTRPEPMMPYMRRTHSLEFSGGAASDVLQNPGAPREETILRVYRFRPVEAFRESITWEDYYLVTDVGEFEKRRKQKQVTRTVKEVIVADDTDLESMGAFVDQILTSLERTPDEAQRALIEKKLTAAGRPVLPALLDRLPPRWAEMDILYRTIGALAEESDVEILKEVLLRAPRLARVIQKKGWGEQFRESILELVGQRHPDLARDALVLAAEFRAPESFEDLRWHIVYGTEQKGTLVDLVKDFPDFDLEPALEEGWMRDRIMNRTSIPIEAGIVRGLPFAVEIARRDLLKQGLPVRHPGPALTALRARVDYAGEEEDFQHWLIKNGRGLRFDPESEMYLAAEYHRDTTRPE